MSERPGSGGRRGGAEVPALLHKARSHYTAGMSVTYAPSVLTGRPEWQPLAPGFDIGTRFHSAPVVRLADAKPMELGHTMLADTRWRLFAFCPHEDPAAEDSAVRHLCRSSRRTPVPLFDNTRPPAPTSIPCSTCVRCSSQGFRELALVRDACFPLAPQRKAWSGRL